MFESKNSKLYQRGNWLSQFGLYRYENENQMKNRRSIIGIYGLLALLSVLIVIVFLFISNEINSEIVKQIPNIENINNKTNNNPQLITTTWPSSIFEENQQNDDKSYETVHIITTSNADLPDNTEDLPDLDMSASDENPSLSMEYRSPYRLHPHQMSSAVIPINHRPSRKQFTVARPFDYILQGTPPTAFQLPANDTTFDSHSISFPQIPKDYVGNVKSIQDILQKVNADDGFIVPASISGDKKIRFGGTYRHRKDNSFADIFDRSKKQHYSGTYILPSASSLKPITESGIIKKDPFYMYKPQRPSDINLLATHEFRFAPPIRYSTPKPLLSKPGYYPSGSMLFNPYTKGQEVSSLYQQIIAANLAHNLKNHKEDESRRSEINQKPFSLMLDVYPMTDDEQPTLTTTRPYVKYRSPSYLTSSNVYTSPNLVAAGVNNPPPHFYLDNQSFYHNFQPQIHKQRLLEAQNYYNQLYLSKLQKTKNSFNPYYHRSPSQTTAESNTPSQITVHLNLFPKNKHQASKKMRNIEILSRNEEPFVSGDDRLTSGNENKENPTQKIEVATIKPMDNNGQSLMSATTTTTESSLKKMLKLEMVPSSSENQSNVHQLLEIEQTSGLGDHHCDTVKCRNEHYQFYNHLHRTTQKAATAAATTTTSPPIMLVESSTLHERAYEIDDDDDQQFISESINQYDQGLVVAARSPTPIPTIIPIEPRSFNEDDYNNSSS